MRFLADRLLFLLTWVASRNNTSQHFRSQLTTGGLRMLLYLYLYLLYLYFRHYISKHLRVFVKLTKLFFKSYILNLKS